MIWLSYTGRDQIISTLPIETTKFSAPHKVNMLTRNAESQQNSGVGDAHFSGFYSNISCCTLCTPIEKVIPPIMPVE